ncbi:MAG: hypothetical protein LBE56_08535 [Tannerella sp.]|jgi:hypothetical protein|nr:hypothetical protein [Tannerella sp.]
MTVVSSKEFFSNCDKYFDKALMEEICIQRGSHLFYLAAGKTVDGGHSKPRQGWALAAKEFVESGNEEEFFPDFFENEDLDWWQWEQK